MGIWRATSAAKRGGTSQRPPVTLSGYLVHAVFVITQLISSVLPGLTTPVWSAVMTSWARSRAPSFIMVRL
jgi:hypothetical protein